MKIIGNVGPNFLIKGLIYEIYKYNIYYYYFINYYYILLLL